MQVGNGPVITKRVCIETFFQQRRYKCVLVFPVMLILVLVLKDALRTIFEVLVLVLESQALVLVLVV